jgi:Cys-tRNA(Pro) deacylase
MWNMSKDDYPITSAIRLLREKKIPFVPHRFRYEEHGGTKLTSLMLGVPENFIVKTLVMETDQKKPFIILMHGDCEVSTKQLARSMGVKQVTPCDAAAAQRVTGYQFGGTSPFGTRHLLPVYAEKTILNLPKIYINGGKQGFIVEIDPHILSNLFHLIKVEVAILSHT